MKNPFRRWLRSAEYRALDERLSELSDHYTVLTERFNRWDARQRQRARRGLDEPDNHARVGDGGGSPVDLPGVVPVSPVADSEAPRYTKEQLRTFARSRGLI